jgi:DNA-binding MarR family transcriptional regulator
MMSHPIWFCEKELVDNLEQTLQRTTALDTDQRQRFYREFDPGMGRVDLLQICWNTRRYQNRRQQQTHDHPLPLTRPAAYILAQLSSAHEMDYAELQARLPLPRSSWKRAINILISRDLIEFTFSSVRIRDVSTSYMIETINAYEAKLFRWREVIQQAHLHDWFTTCSYVVMPEMSQRVLPRLLEQCHASGVGVVLYHDKNDRTIPVIPAQRELPLTHIGWLLNEQLFDEECRYGTTTPSSYRGDSCSISSPYH